MIVGLLSLELILPEAHSLKDKRMVLRAVKDRLRHHNVSVAEVEHQDLWQRAGLAVVTVSSAQDPADRTLAAVLDDIERAHPGLVARTSIDWLT